MVGMGSKASDPTGPTPRPTQGNGKDGRHPSRSPLFPGPAEERPQTYPQQSQEAPIRSTQRCTPAPSSSTAPHPHPTPPRPQWPDSHSDPHSPRHPFGPCPLSPVVPFAHTVVEPLAVVVEAAHTLVAGTAVLRASTPGGGGEEQCDWSACSPLGCCRGWLER